MDNTSKLNYLEEVAAQCIDEAKKEKAVVITCVDGFQTDIEALRLRDMLWYAKRKGVVVHFVPDESKIDKKGIKQYNESE